MSISHGLAALASSGLVACSPGPTVYRGGPVITLDDENRVVEALATDGEQIVAVGSLEDVAPWIERGARVVELDGRALLPGFIDAHGHFPGSGIYELVADLNSPPIGPVKTVDGVVAALERRAREVSSGDWVVGMGYDDTLLAERRHPTRTDLDRATREHPVAAFHVSGHLAVVNSAGLAALGLDAGSEDPVGGRIRRDADSGEPDGVLEESAIKPLEHLLLNPGVFDSARIMQAATEEYLSRGVTTAQNGFAAPDHAAMFSALARFGLLPIRVVIWPGGSEAGDRMVDGSLSRDSSDPNRVRIGAVKLVADGSIQGYTGYLSQPYHVTPPGEADDYRGYPRIPKDQLAILVARYHRAGLQIAVHGNGDASIDDILDAFEAAQREHPREDARFIVIHAQMARDDQLDRMRELGVIPSFFSLHTYYWGDRHREIFMGPARAARMSPARSALDRGLRFTIHADTPVVPMEPLRLVDAAVHRRSRSDRVVGPEQRIDVVSALRAITLDAAYQHFEEHLKGSLEVGKLADLVILDRSPLEHPSALREIRVLETVVGGETVYRAEDGAAGSGAG